jgi:NADH-quinone oxidoreductase subunit L
MLVPLAGLALGAMFAGVVFRHCFIGRGVSEFWRQSLFLGRENHILEESEHVPWPVSLSPTLMMLGGLLVAYYMYVIEKTVPRRLAVAFPGSTLPPQQVVVRRAP